MPTRRRKNGVSEQEAHFFYLYIVSRSCLSTLFSLYSLTDRFMKICHTFECASTIQSDVGDSTIAAGRPSDRTDRRPSYAGESKFWRSFDTFRFVLLFWLGHYSSGPVEQ